MANPSQLRHRYLHNPKSKVRVHYKAHPDDTKPDNIRVTCKRAQKRVLKQQAELTQSNADQHHQSRSRPKRLPYILVLLCAKVLAHIDHASLADAGDCDKNKPFYIPCRRITRHGFRAKIVNRRLDKNIGYGKKSALETGRQTVD